MSAETKRFTMEITMGNAAMLTPQDVAEALKVVAGRLESGDEHGMIHDLNGNRVGWFAGEFEEEGA